MCHRIELTHEQIVSYHHPYDVADGAVGKFEGGYHSILQYPSESYWDLSFMWFVIRNDIKRWLQEIAAPHSMVVVYIPASESLYPSWHFYIEFDRLEHLLLFKLTWC